ncbi:hypothetical protein [Candidatus Entotheonella palauensis]|uniref:hypothetical protein n=1 Tax=Candidatus Entotheonella palauensis TaxID=93172 RepID=UPI000B7C9CB8|nr:hypothetical protein [Candidatus Entotheonella palauensis]
MAFLRKHRDRYWLVHNFRNGGKVRQVRLYGFDLQADLDEEIQRAQQAAASCSAGPIAPNWVQPVRQQLEHLQTAAQQTHLEQLTRRFQGQVQDMLQTLASLNGHHEAKQQLIWDCISQLHQQLATRTAPVPQHMDEPPRALPSEELLDLGDGFCLSGSSLYHRCNGVSGDGTAHTPDNETRSPVVWVSLIQGRDLWIECEHCHAKCDRIQPLTQLPRLSVRRQRIRQFDRFCIEHAIGNTGYILVTFRSGYIDRISVRIVEIDYRTQKVRLVSDAGRKPRTYWRRFDNVYFGTLEVRLTPEQHQQLTAAGVTDILHLVRIWYTVTDTPPNRMQLQQAGVRY